MTVIRSFPGRIRFAAQSPAAVQYLQQQAEKALDTIKTDVAVEYNPRTKRGLLLFEKNRELTDLLVGVIDGMAHTLSSTFVESDADGACGELVPVAEGVAQSEEHVENPVWVISKKVINHYMTRMFMPATIRPYWTAFNVAPLIWEGLKSLGQRKLDVNVLDAAAVGSALAMRDFNTAGTINLLLDISETLEEWTKEKSRSDIAALFCGDKKPVWVMRDDEPVAVSPDELVVGDLVVVRSGARIPVDGIVAEGTALVNQSSMTGEPLAVEKSVQSEVYSGTVVEEGRIIIYAESVGDETRFAKIAKILTESDDRKADIHSQAVKMADKIVPFSFILSGIVYAVTRNATQAAAVLLADYSCAIKLATPLAVRSAMLEAAHNGAVIKGGKYLEHLSKLDAIVLDKTGTLTEARPEVVQVCALNGFSEEFVLQQAACMEEHFPHPVADAVVRKADEEGLVHSEDHAEVEYILAHGIATTLDGQRTVLGSKHFVHEDEHISFEGAEDVIAECSGAGLSLLYFACGGELAGVLAIKDPVREDAEQFIRNLEGMDVERIIMLTGDGEDTAASVAADLRINEYYAQALPDEKTELITSLRSEGYTVAMVGDGINDSAALTTADVGVSMKHGADIAREACDIMLTGERLDSLTDAMEVSKRVMRRIKRNFMFIVASNTLFIGLGVTGLITPALMALLHNSGTVLTCVHSMRPMLPERKDA
ncbi:heavy metal translocating P-type ATPase [Halodesulfovibrio sp.]|jgi:heavy metal translocating P-type ATPase|uniref:heavy metal translocating P-type ATPase n=1 Tax=Halodesulfovibrio sp. TaxID=1912772 RepID=UPI0025ECE424|nr:heavy metal translocating P-type ATPase [Halodesulfovibrio sp.]MCT4535922.1 heavy metal translocating P-type ATPase [Halodesulfovibrio sp.]MCT4626367.1 heavy metal translocating P-type ATPase [Halodesulfovibrio sp.]